MFFKRSQKKQKGFHFILEETTNSKLIERGYVGQRFVTDTIPTISSRVVLKNSNGEGFAISVNELKDLNWAGNLELVMATNCKIGIGTMVQSKNSTHILKLVDVVH